MRKQLAILGARSSGNKVLTALHSGSPRIYEGGGSPEWRVVCFADNDLTADRWLANGKQNGISVVAMDGIPHGCEVISGIGDPDARQNMMRTSKRLFALVAHPSALIAGTVEGGSLLCANSIVSTGGYVCVGVTMNIGAVIGPDALVEPWVTINQYAVIASNATVRERSYIGMGARILEGRQIAEQTMIGAGAVVTKDITEPNGVYVGMPARRVKEWRD